MVERNAGVSDKTAAWTFGSAFIWAMLSKSADGDLMGDGVNIAARNWKASPSLARFVSPRKPIGRSERGSISRSATWAKSNSRTSPSRFGPIRSRWASP